MTAIVMPNGKLRFYKLDGTVLVGGKLHTYEAGTAIRKDTYVDQASTIPNTNPIILDIRGEAFVRWDGSYKYILTDENDVVIETIDDFNDATVRMSSAAGGGLVGFIYGAVYSIGSIGRWLQDLALSAGSSFIGFIQSGAGAEARVLQEKVREVATLFDYIPVAQHAAIVAGTSVYDCTADVAAAFIAHDTVYAGPGKFNVSTFNLAANKRLLTAGKATTFAQIAGTPLGTRMIIVTGSNVCIGSMTVRGNIATDTNEQNHSIFVQAAAGTGNLRNIEIGDIDGYDIRGDVVYLAANSPNTLWGVTVGQVYGNNILRNVVSIVGGYDIRIESVYGEGVGFATVDLEPEPYSTPVTSVQIGYIYGRVVGINSASAVAPISGVEINAVDLDMNRAVCVPAYAGGATVADCLLLRNIAQASINYVKARNAPRSAAFVITNVGELGCKSLRIGHLDVADCALTDVVYASFLMMANGGITIDSINAVVTGARSLMINAAGARIRNVVSTQDATSTFLRNCVNTSVDGFTVTGGIFNASGVGNNRFSNGTHAGTILTNFTGPCLFENVTATGSTYLYDSANDRHMVMNCTLGGVYFAYGTTKSGYTSPMAFGNYREFVETATGKYRTKGGIPTSETDGTVIGTQT